MLRVGKKRNFMLESQSKELKETKEIVKIVERNSGGTKAIDLILEPTKIDELNKECRLTLEEYVDAINDLIEQEEDDWESLRMKDQIDLTRDIIIERTVLKYVREKLGMDLSGYDATNVSYMERLNENRMPIGKAIMITLMAVNSH